MFFEFLLIFKLFRRAFEAQTRKTFGRGRVENFPESSEWRIRVTCAKISADHRRLTLKEQSQNLASKRENKDPLRVNLLPSLTSPPYPSNPEVVHPQKRREQQRQNERQIARNELDISMPRISLFFNSLELSISRKQARESYVCS